MTFKEVVGMNGPISKIGTTLFEIIYCNFIWLLFAGFLPMVALNIIPFPNTQTAYIIVNIVSMILLLHIGPASTAAFSAMGKRQRKEETYTFRDFWHSYKQNYKQGLIVTLIFTLVTGILIYAIWLELENMELFGKMLYLVIPVQGFVIIEMVFIFTYIFALLARFEMTTKNLFKYSFMMANKHLPTTIICVAMLVGCIAAFLYWNMASSLFSFGVFFYLGAMLLEKVFRNYMPDEDQALEEEVVEGYNMDAERQKIIDRYTGKINQENDNSK